MNRLQKMLEGANIKLSGTVSTINGLSSRNILNFIMDGGVFSEDVFKEMLRKKEISYHLKADPIWMSWMSTSGIWMMRLITI